MEYEFHVSSPSACGLTLSQWHLWCQRSHGTEGHELILISTAKVIRYNSSGSEVIGRMVRLQFLVLLLGFLGTGTIRLQKCTC
jgi:hypothetical protein